MSEQRHTPGRMVVREHPGMVLIGPEDNKFFDIAKVQGFNGPEARVNARRLAAAWNFVDGTSTENLEPDGLRSMIFESDALRQANAALLRALKELGDWLAHGLANPPGAQPTAADLAECERLAKQARAVVDRAEGRTT